MNLSELVGVLVVLGLIFEDERYTAFQRVDKLPDRKNLGFGIQATNLYFSVFV